MEQWLEKIAEDSFNDELEKIAISNKLRSSYLKGISNRLKGSLSYLESKIRPPKGSKKSVRKAHRKGYIKSYNDAHELGKVKGRETKRAIKFLQTSLKSSNIARHMGDKKRFVREYREVEKNKIY